MSNNYWSQKQEDGNGNNPLSLPSTHGNGVPKSGGLLRQYSAQSQTQQSQQTQGPSPISPIPPSQQFPQGQQQLVAYNSQPYNSQQNVPPQQGGHSPSIFGNAMNYVRQWSGKVSAMRGSNAAPEPLVLYHPNAPTPVRPVRRKPWRRSHAVRLSMQMRRRRARLQHSRPGSKKILSRSLITFSIVLVVLLSSGFAWAYAYYQSQSAHLQQLANEQTDQSTRIYDRNFKLIYTAYDGRYGRGTAITYNYVPGVMQDAMIAAEDHTFWNNSGIDLQGILRAATQYASNGYVDGGGSTITQQVIKNLTHNDQVSLQRKIPEAVLAIGLTQQYPKWKILEMYFNVAPFGAQELGVDAAAADYFGLHAQCDQNFKCIPAIAFLDRDLTRCGNPRDLTTCKPDPLLGLARASLLAGMPQNPPAYDPTVNQSTNIPNALLRQDYVLNQMLGLNMSINLGLGDQTQDSGLGLITPAIIQQVENYTRTKMHFVGFQNTKLDPHFVDWIIPIIENALGNGDGQLGAQLFLTGGFNIRTTIDSTLETFIEGDVYHQLNDKIYQIFVNDYGPLSSLHNVNDSAVVVEDAKSGEILAMDGSSNYNSTLPEIAGQVNAATSPRPPGSSFKPIVYATAFQMGWYPGIVLPDMQTYFPGSSQSLDVNQPGATYIPSDYGGTATKKYYHNLNSNILLDIANSFNVPAVKAVEYAGFDNVLNMARRFGITDIDADTVLYNQMHKTHLTTEQTLGPAFGLGAYNVSLLQMVSAYQVFADQGMRVPPQYVLDIWDNYGHHIYQYDPTKPPTTRVISQQLAYLMTTMLSDNKARAIEFSPDTVLTTQNWDNRPVAAKTGTTDGFADNWTIGYTPDIVVGVWSGNANDQPMKNVVGITGAAPIWRDALEYASGLCFPAGSLGSFPGPWSSCGDLKFPADQFIQPAEVSLLPVNTFNGLQGTGYYSWVVDSDVPVSNGFPNGVGTGTGTGTPTPTPTPTGTP